MRRLREMILLCVLPNTQSYLHFRVEGYKKEVSSIPQPTQIKSISWMTKDTNCSLLTTQGADNKVTLTSITAVTIPLLATKRKIICQ